MFDGRCCRPAGAAETVESRLEDRLRVLAPIEVVEVVDPETRASTPEELAAELAEEAGEAEDDAGGGASAALSVALGLKVLQHDPPRSRQDPLVWRRPCRVH